MATPDITLFHAPRTRSSGVLALLEEIGAPYKLHLLDRGKNEHLAADYLAINPMGKVPAILDGGAVVTETIAIFIHLADRFPASGLAPPIGDAHRGPYLRWLVFYAACFEPAVVDRALGREPGTRALSPYGDYDTVIQTLSTALAAGPYLLGHRFSAADILWNAALSWTTAFGMVPQTPVIMDYIHRVAERPALVAARAKDEAMAAAQAA